MSNLKPKVLVVAGDGINCEVETAQAFQMAQFDTQIRHLNDLITEQLSLDELCLQYSALALPGGFSFGDDLNSGKVLALKIQHRLGWDLPAYAARGGLVIGICNGFQTLIRMGIFGKDVSITHNAQGKFVNSWAKVTPVGNKCIWLKGLGTLDLPIRHGEGRVVIASVRRSETLDKMERSGMISLRYEGDPNGSEEKIAGLSDPSGRIFGLMPHPEAFVRWTSHPEWTGQPGRASAPGQGLAVFENAYQEALRVRS
ncbi:MAG: phosphoribosylformylglycinamidine synthase subunit PurQ [Bdellovibrio sp.]|nr:phosphoribosylformylglycinamidine synthase subunit PurQ [Bdellovibrio sp.]